MLQFQKFKCFTVNALFIQKNEIFIRKFIKSGNLFKREILFKKGILFKNDKMLSSDKILFKKKTKIRKQKIQNSILRKFD